MRLLFSDEQFSKLCGRGLAVKMAPRLWPKNYNKTTYFRLKFENSISAIYLRVKMKLELKKCNSF